MKDLSVTVYLFFFCFKNHSINFNIECVRNQKLKITQIGLSDLLLSKYLLSLIEAMIAEVSLLEDCVEIISIK